MEGKETIAGADRLSIEDVDDANTVLDAWLDAERRAIQRAREQRQ